MTYVKWKMENETTKAPPSVVRLGHGASRHLARPAIRPGHDDLFDQELFPAKRDLLETVIFRVRAFDAQMVIYFNRIVPPSTALKAGSIPRSANLPRLRTQAREVNQ